MYDQIYAFGDEYNNDKAWEFSTKVREKNEKQKIADSWNIPKIQIKIVERGKIYNVAHKYMTDHIPGLVQALQ